MLDLCYREDFRAQLDFNVVLTERGELVELQGATEAASLSQAAGCRGPRPGFPRRRTPFPGPAGVNRASKNLQSQ